ncbi:hypothetical protein EBS80_04140, partial [bacterium]|nr:hypothetical protein [bacterium]
MNAAASSGKPHYLWASFTSLILIGIVKAVWPSLIPFGFWDVWESPHGIVEGVKAGWPILAWGLFHFIRTWIFLDTNSREYVFESPWDNFVQGVKTSLWAGITEEIAFRWLIYLGAIPSLVLGNFLFFGWAGFGIAEWFHLHVWGALANWTTFGILAPQILNPTYWFAGAAILYSNAFFREGHAYQGFLIKIFGNFLQGSDLVRFTGHVDNIEQS